MISWHAGFSQLAFCDDAPIRWEEVILGMEDMGGVRYYFLCHLNGSHVIQFLKTAIRCRASNNLAGDGM